MGCWNPPLGILRHDCPSLRDPDMSRAREQQQEALDLVRLLPCQTSIVSSRGGGGRLSSLGSSTDQHRRSLKFPPGPFRLCSALCWDTCVSPVSATHPTGNKCPLAGQCALKKQLWSSQHCYAVKAKFNQVGKDPLTLCAEKC